MRWADAVALTGKAERTAKDDEPNIVLKDKEHFKAFRAREKFGWKRVLLRTAGAFDDWRSVERTSWE